MPEEPHEVQKVVLEQWYKNITFWQKLMQYAITGLFLDYHRGFIKGRAPGKLTGCEYDFAWLLYISKNFFLLQGTIKNSFKLQ